MKRNRARMLIGGTYRIMTYVHRNHENCQGPSVLGSKCPGSKCPWGPGVPWGATWIPGTFGPRTFRPLDLSIIILYVRPMLKHSSTFFLIFMNFHDFGFYIHASSYKNYTVVRIAIFSSTPPYSL